MIRRLKVRPSCKLFLSILLLRAILLLRTQPSHKKTLIIHRLGAILRLKPRFSHRTTLTVHHKEAVETLLPQNQDNHRTTSILHHKEAVEIPLLQTLLNHKTTLTPHRWEATATLLNQMPTTTHRKLEATSLLQIPTTHKKLARPRMSQNQPQAPQSLFQSPQLLLPYNWELLNPFQSLAKLSKKPPTAACLWETSQLHKVAKLPSLAPLYPSVQVTWQSVAAHTPFPRLQLQLL